MQSEPSPGNTPLPTTTATTQSSSASLDRWNDMKVGRLDVERCLREISTSHDLNLMMLIKKGSQPGGLFWDKELKELSGLPYEVHTTQFFENSMLEECAWLELPESIIGLEIGITLGKYQLLPPDTEHTIKDNSFAKNWGVNINAVRLGTIGIAMLTFTLQFYVVFCLWFALPLLKGNESFCRGQIGPYLQLCSVGVFLLSIIPSVKDISLELLVVLTSHRLKREASEADTTLVRQATANPYWQASDLVHIRLLNDKDPSWIIPCLFIILLELVIWIMTLFVGCKYLLISETVSDLVQSMVAIVFVNEVDNLAFDVFVPRNVKKTLSRIEFEVPYLKGPGGKPQSPLDSDSDAREYKIPRNVRTRLQKNIYKMSLLGSVPIVIIVAVTVVFGLHGMYC